MDSEPRVVIAAGGVVTRAVPVGAYSRIDTLLLHDSSRSEWRLPKGIVEPGETLSQAAVREIREETGRRCILVGPIGSASWFYTWEGQEWLKLVCFYLAVVADDMMETRDGEFSDLDWMSLPEAYDLLTFQSEKDILANASMRIASEPWLATAQPGSD